MKPNSVIDPVQSIHLNNKASELFELGDLHRAAAFYRDAIRIFTDATFAASASDGEGEAIAEFESPPSLVTSWTKPSQALPAFMGQSEGDVFLHARVAFLCPHCFIPCWYKSYASIMLHNVAVCFHLLYFVENSLEHGKRATSLYSMALNVGKESRNASCVVLQTIQFSNFGHLLFQEGRMYEASKCFSAVRQLLARIPQTAFDKDVFVGMYLNSLMSSNTASAA
jgi:tetratricopeptide (TPR) repeat protein